MRVSQLTPYHLLISLFIISLLAGIWLYYLNTPDKTPRLLVSEETQLDELMLNAITTRFNEEGEKVQQLSIHKLSHIINDDKTHFEKPLLTVYEKGQPIWHIQANAGHSLHADANNRFHQINLQDNVTLKHFAQDTTPWILLTNYLTIDPHTQTTYTSSPITLKTKGMVLTATGLEGNFKTNEVKFLHNINATYSPKEIKKKS